MRLRPIFPAMRGTRYAFFFRYGVRFYGQLDDVRFSKWTIPFVSKATTLR